LGNKNKNELYCNKVGIVKCSICGKMTKKKDFYDSKNLICVNCYKSYRNQINEGLLWKKLEI